MSTDTFNFTTRSFPDPDISLAFSQMTIVSPSFRAGVGMSNWVTYNNENYMKTAFKLFGYVCLQMYILYIASAMHKNIAYKLVGID